MKSSARLPRLLALGVVLVIAAGYVVNAMDRIVFPTLLPSLSNEYEFTLLAGGLQATIFTFGFGIAGIPGGFLLDRMSRKAVAIVGICLYSLCTVLTCVSVGFYDMALYRVLSGVGEALQNTAIFTMAGAYFAHNRTLAFGLLNSAYGIGSFIAPRWGAHLLATTGSWRFPLYIYGMIGLVAALALFLLVPKRFSEWHAGEVASLLDDEQHIPVRLVNRNTMLVAVVAVTGGIAGFGYLGLYPTFLRTELHFSVEQAGAAASMFGAGALMGLLCGYLADRINQKWLSIVSLAALTLVGYALFNIVTTPFWQGVFSFSPRHGAERLLLRQQLLAYAAIGPLEPHWACVGPFRDVHLPAGFFFRIYLRCPGWLDRLARSGAAADRRAATRSHHSHAVLRLRQDEL